MSKPKLILLVEDYEGFRNSLKQLLELEEYTVIEAETGEQALELAKKNVPDLILMDLTLPGIDGLAATRKIREIPELQSIPVIALSAYDVEDFRNDAKQAGCNDYVTKPIDFDHFTKVIRKLFS
jgi:CheY-like chemotaxis protein